MNLLDMLTDAAKRDFYKRQSEREPRLSDWASDTERDPLAHKAKGKGAVIEQPYFKRGQLGATTTADALWSGDTNPDAVNAMYIHSRLPDDEWSKVADLQQSDPVIFIEGILPELVKRDTKAHEQRHATLQNPDLQLIIKQNAPEAETGPDVDTASDYEEALVRFNDYFAGKDPYTKAQAQKAVDPQSPFWYELQRQILQGLK